MFAVSTEFLQSISFPGRSSLICSTLALRAAFYGAKEITDGEEGRAAQSPTEHLESDLALSCGLHLPLNPLPAWAPPSPNPAGPAFLALAELQATEAKKTSTIPHLSSPSPKSPWGGGVGVGGRLRTRGFNPGSIPSLCA